MSDLHSRRANRSGILQAAALGLLGIGLMLEPWGVQRTLSAGLRDGLLPGQWALRRIEQSLAWCESRFWPRDPVEQRQRDLLSELKSADQRYRRLEIEHAALNERFQRARERGLSPYQATNGVPLLVPELVTARVFGREYGNPARAARLLGLGSGDGALRGDLVMGDSDALLDQGRSEDVRIGQPVYSGATVVGRIASVGRWVSTVQPVTDPRYRGRVQLARTTAQGVVFGAEGILRGRAVGGCSIHGIKATEAVAVGDRVYTGGRSGTLPYPMYYGRVSRVQREPDGQEWNILVDPAIDLQQVHSVQVLRDSINPVRILGH